MVLDLSLENDEFVTEEVPDKGGCSRHKFGNVDPELIGDPEWRSDIGGDEGDNTAIDRYTNKADGQELRELEWLFFGLRLILERPVFVEEVTIDDRNGKGDAV